MKLTPRLLAVAESVCGKTTADIGTDHGKLLIYLVQQNKIESGIGSDVADGPADACRRNVRRCGLSGKIEIRVGDGLSTLQPAETESIVIAGMGGELILRILEDNLETAKAAKELILQPMTNIGRLLEGLPRIGFAVTEGKLAKEKDKLYQVFKVHKGCAAPQKKIDFIICPAHLKGNSPYLVELIKRELRKYTEQREGLLAASVQNGAEIQTLDALIKELKAYETQYNS